MPEKRSFFSAFIKKYGIWAEKRTSGGQFSGTCWLYQNISLIFCRNQQKKTEKVTGI
jgi:hypothetical protein